MAYTVKKLSLLSKTTVRALHFYEKIGLLKPAYYGENGYRYYEEKELIQLQQILFFKELGFTLKEIGKVLRQEGFDPLAALYSHRKAIAAEREKMGQLLKTIDRTIEHLKGQKKMKDEEIFEGFTLVKADPKNQDEALVLKSVLNPRKEKLPQAEIAWINKRAAEIFRKLIACMKSQRSPHDAIREHHAFTSEYFHATKEVYQALSRLYLSHPDFRKQLDFYHPELASFMAKAMAAFAEKELAY